MLGTGLTMAHMRPFLLPNLLYTHTTTLCRRKVLVRYASTRSKTRSNIHGHFKPSAEPFTPPPVIQRAVSSLLNDAFKNGTFSWDHTVATCLSVLVFSLAHTVRGPSVNGEAARRSFALTYNSVSLRLAEGRLLATFDFSTTR